MKDHELFRREGLDVWMDLPISFVQATLGAQIKVPTLEGEDEIEIPRGIDAGETISLKGKGFPEIRGNHRGNQIVRVVLKTPKHLTSKQEDLLRQFAEEGGEKEAPKEGKSKSKKKRKFPWSNN